LKITVEEIKGITETEIIVKCGKADAKIEELLSLLRFYDDTITGKKNGILHIIRPDEIYYIDTVDDKVFIYTEKEVYEADLRLYEITERFEKVGLIRINKSTVVNLMKIKKINSVLNGKIKAVLANNEAVLVSRQYVAQLKEKLGIGGGKKG
jgi:DNA-binding LytR/AlgR family response regulator